MMRFWIIAAVTVLGIALAGCGRGTAGPPSGPSDRTLVEVTQTQPAAEECPPDAACAPENDRTVPAVVGVPVEDACRVLGRRGYSGGIFAVRGNGGEGAGRMVAQAPKPAAEYFLGGMVHLIVSGPFAVGELSPDSYCVDRTDLGMKQFPVD
jgi:hypothetical protein